MQQAEKHILHARKCVTKPTIALFWSADYDTSAQEYEKAASCYKSCQLYDKCIQAHLQASQAWVRANSYFMAAKNAEAAANLTLTQLNNPVESAQLLKQAADFYVLNSTSDRAAEILDKAAKLTEDTKDSDLVFGYYDESIELYMNETRPRFAIDVTKRAFAFASRLQLSTKATAYLQSQIDLYTEMSSAHNVSKTVLSLILYKLSNGDTVGATAEFENGALLLQREEALLASKILDAINNVDQDLLHDLVMKSPQIQFLDQAVIRAARLINTEICLPTVVAPGVVAIPGFTPASTYSAPAVAIPGFSAPSALTPSQALLGASPTPVPLDSTPPTHVSKDLIDDDDDFC